MPDLDLPDHLWFLLHEQFDIFYKQAGLADSSAFDLTIAQFALGLLVRCCPGR
jgi:hypothetical protein